MPRSAATLLPPRLKAAARAGASAPAAAAKRSTVAKPERKARAGSKAAAKAPGAGLADIEDIITPAEWGRRNVNAAVLKWYDAHRRPLPWRAAGTAPYAVWVSEIMAQQTQIATMLPYWQRWMRAFPTVAALAAAPAETVREHWSGLGYYRRAEFLHKGAQHVASALGGELPRSAADLVQIPGIGPYTAAAIASICFSEHAAVVDGNVLRVVARLRGERDCSAKSDRAFIAQAWKDASRLIAHSARPGDHNQAMMEIGATVCKPNAEPSCDECPFASVCRARRLKESGEIAAINGVIPIASERAVQRSEFVATAVVVSQAPVAAPTTSPGRRSGSSSRSSTRSAAAATVAPVLLLERRPPSGLLANLFQCPTVSTTERATKASQQVALAAQIRALTGFSPVPSKLVFRDSVMHIFSHIRMKIAVFSYDAPPNAAAAAVKKAKGRVESKGAADDTHRWVPLSEVSSAATTAIVPKVVRTAGVTLSSAGRKRSRSSSADRGSDADSATATAAAGHHARDGRRTESR